MRVRVRAVFLATLATAVLVSGGAAADVVTLPASQDTSLYEEDGELSNGAGDFLFSGNTKNGVLRRALLAFDVSSIPAGSTINSVSLTMFVSRTRTGDTPVSLHRILAAWGESTSDAPGEEGEGAAAADGDATWLYRFFVTANPPTSPAWASPGGDFDPTPSATAIVPNQNNFASWSSGGMASDVQSWVDGALPNDGWILIGNEVDTRVAKRLDSRENPDTARRPALLVDFTPTAPTGACCATDGGCTVVLDPGGACAGSYEGIGTVCTPNPCPQPTGACCLPDALATCTEDTEAGCGIQGGTFQGAASICAATECPVVLEPFVDALPIPAVAQPVSGSAGGAASYQMAMREVQQQFHRDLPLSTVWGYGDGPTGASYPGPTILGTSNEPITVTWINDLRDITTGQLRTAHYLSPVDTCPHGADDDSPRTVVHLHGAHVAAEFDGYPEDTFLPGGQDVYEYENQQLPATLWYHDHALGITRLNVYMGLAGFYLLSDATEQALGLPSGEFEIGLAVQDRTFRPDGSLVYPTVWQDHFFGDTIVVNGKAWPFLNVKQGKYRFRVLGGSNSRSYRLALANAATFQVIGQEGGLLPAPVTVNEITLGPGERADLIIDFAPYLAGTEIVLTNSAPAPFPGDPGVGVIPQVMKFIVGSEPGHTDPVPAVLREIEVLQESDASVARTLELAKGADPCSGQVWLINGLGWDDITELPTLGDTEIWSFVNRSGITHPMHMHLVMFQVLDRQAFDEVGGEVVPIGSRVPPPPHESGWKDTVQVGPNEIVRVIARFENYIGLYPYHCHILEHEDHEMMRQFQTTTVCGDGFLGKPDEECDDGNTIPGDGCSAACEIEDSLTLYGGALGGSVELQVDAVPLVIPTTDGQTTEQVAQAIADAINADPTLSAAGLTTFAAGSTVVTTGTISELLISDPGLTPFPISALGRWMLYAMAALLLSTALVLRVRLARPSRAR